VDTEPAIELPPAQPTFSSIVSGTVEIGLPTSAAVPSVSNTADGVSPSSLPPISLLVPAIALADPVAIGDAHPAVQPTTSCKSCVNSVIHILISL
jgi:hypothetical protein